MTDSISIGLPEWDTGATWRGPYFGIDRSAPDGAFTIEMAQRWRQEYDVDWTPVDPDMEMDIGL